jgi:hypothetical protein
MREGRVKTDIARQHSSEISTFPLNKVLSKVGFFLLPPV